MSNEELILLLDDFINENAMWGRFADYLESKGYILAEYELVINSIEG